MPAQRNKTDDDVVDVAMLRKHAHHFLEPEVARTVGISLAELQQFSIGHFHLPPDNSWRANATAAGCNSACGEHVPARSLCFRNAVALARAPLRRALA